MDKYIITESQLKLIKESIEIEKIILPDFIKNSITQHKTSLGNHPAFPLEDEMSFQEKILKKRYMEVLTNIKKVDGVDGNISKKHLINLLETFVIKAKKIEEPIKADLEELCFKFVNDIFGIKYGDLDIECVLDDSVSMKLPITPKPLTDSEFEDVDEVENLNKEIMKRRMVNSLVQGASVRLSSDFDAILNKIYKLNPKLPELYYNIVAVNEYLSFVKEIKPNDDNIGGAVSVNLSSDEPKIYSEAIIFPTLVFETVKGVMELLSSNGLPESKKSAEYVINKSDFLLAENWDKRFGVGMWDIFVNLVGEDKGLDVMSKSFVELISIPANNFDRTMKEVLSKTKKGKSIIKSIVDDVVRTDKFSEIENTVSSKDEDEFFTPEELNSDENIILDSTNTTSVGNYTFDAPAFVDDETADHTNMIAKSIPKQ